MIRKRKFIGGFLTKVLAFIGYLALNSCGDSNNAFLENEEPIPVQLNISLTDSGYTSDGELIPMNTRADKSYNVTQIISHTLFILKKVGNDWIVEDIRTDVIQPLSGLVLKNGESLSLTESGENFVLLPGTYRFALYLNVDSSVKIGDVISENSTQSMISSFFPLTDFYFAQDDVLVEKCGNLDISNETSVELKLERKSSLIRFILEGTGWTKLYDPSVSCNLSGQTCIGMDISGNPVVGNWDNVMLNKEFQISIKMSNRYMIGGKPCYFTAKTNNKLSLFAIDDTPRNIQLTIRSIGNIGDYSFQGSHNINITISKNHITTVLIRKDPDNINVIKTEVNPDIVWNDDYPPLDYIELNN